MDTKILNILRCPITKQKLSLLDNKRYNNLLELIEQKMLKNKNGDVIEQLPQHAMITENNHTIYLVFDEIPVMLETQSIDNTNVNI